MNTALPGVRRRMKPFQWSSKAGNCRHPVARQVGHASRASVLAFVVFGLPSGLATSSALSENMPSSANELVREVITNEIKVEAADHSHWAFQLQTEKDGKKEIDQVIET